MGKNKLTPRQWRLYDFLCENIEIYQQLFDIYNALSDLYPGITKAKNFANSHARRELTRDLTALENNDDIYVIIVRGSQGIKLAENYEEAKLYLDTVNKSILESLKRNKKQYKKLSRHNQTRVVFGKEKDIIKAYKEVAV